MKFATTASLVSPGRRISNDFISFPSSGVSTAVLKVTARTRPTQSDSGGQFRTVGDTQGKIARNTRRDSDESEALRRSAFQLYDIIGLGVGLGFKVRIIFSVTVRVNTCRDGIEVRPWG